MRKFDKALNFFENDYILYIKMIEDKFIYIKYNLSQLICSRNLNRKRIYLDHRKIKLTPIRQIYEDNSYLIYLSYYNKSERS